MEQPPAPPEAALIRLARQASNIRMAQAAEEAGVSLARWSHIENGHEKRQGTIRPVKAKADTLARMARAVGVSPERLETEGCRPDAAGILREILRAEPAPAPPRLAAAPPARDPFGEPSEVAQSLFPGDRLKQWIWSAPGSEEEKAAAIRAVDLKRAELRGDAGRAEGTA